MKFRILVAGLAACCLVSIPLQAQGIDRPAISVAASGRVEVDADHAKLTLGVNVQDSTPTLAAAQMDARLIALTDTLIALGFPRDSLPNAVYQVTPSRDYRAGQQIVGYSANAAVTVTIWEIARLPTVIEAALASGATDVGGLQFGTSDAREAQDEALRRAISAAQHDAAVMADAAGGSLGSLIEIATSQANIRQARTMEFSAVGTNTPEITPRTIIVVANVTAQWVFVEN